MVLGTTTLQFFPGKDLQHRLHTARALYQQVRITGEAPGHLFGDDADAHHQLFFAPAPPQFLEGVHIGGIVAGVEGLGGVEAVHQPADGDSLVDGDRRPDIDDHAALAGLEPQLLYPRQDLLPDESEGMPRVGGPAVVDGCGCHLVLYGYAHIRKDRQRVTVLDKIPDVLYIGLSLVADHRRVARQQGLQAVVAHVDKLGVPRDAHGLGGLPAADHGDGKVAVGELAQEPADSRRHSHVFRIGHYGDKGAIQVEEENRPRGVIDKRLERLLDIVQIVGQRPGIVQGFIGHLVEISLDSVRLGHRNNKERSRKVQVSAATERNPRGQPPGALRAAALAALRLSLILLFLAMAVHAGWREDAAAAPGGISISTDRLVYHPGDTISFELALDAGPRSLTGDLIMTVYPPASPLAADAFSRPPLTETSISRNFSVSGQAGESYKASVEELELDAGGYPARVSLVQDGEELLGGNTWLAVAEPGAREPVELVLLWTVGAPPERNAGGEFESLALVERCRTEPPRPDSLRQHQALQQAFPRVRTTYAIEPALLDQLAALAGGFDLREGGDVGTYSGDSPEAAAAAACLESLKALAAGENTEILSSPYVFTDLPLLALQGWADGNGQFRLGNDVLVDLLALPAAPRGAYAPGLDVTTDSLRYLAATGGEYTVLRGADRASVQGRLPAGAPTYRLRDLSGERITVMFAADDASAALTGESPEPAAFFAALANAYASGDPNRLVITAAAAPAPAVAAAQRERVYAELEREPWIHSLTLAEARQKHPPDTEPSTLLKYVDPVEGYVAETYFQKLEAAHGLFEAYRAAVDSDEPELLRLSRKMYTAESVYLAGSGAAPAQANRGLAYLDDASGFVRGEFQRLSIDVDTPWLQGVESGEATVTIINGNLYPLTVDIVLAAGDVEFPEWSEQRLRLETGKVELKVPFRSQGWSRIEARMQSQGHTIVDDSAVVHLLNGRVWIVVLVVVAALLAGGAYFVLVARRR